MCATLVSSSIVSQSADQGKQGAVASESGVGPVARPIWTAQGMSGGSTASGETHSSPTNELSVVVST